MIHPGLDNIRSVAVEAACETEKAYRIRPTQTHTERLHRESKSSDLSTYGSDIGQRKHFWLEDFPITIQKQLEKHRLCAADGKTSDEMQQLDHNTFSRASRVRIASLSRSNSRTMRQRALSPSSAPSARRRISISCHALAKASGSREPTMTPVSPTMCAESPTSVATQGTPQAIASPITLGKPSP